jgi:hypothetical protein
MSKHAAMRRGRIEFFDNTTKKPRCPDCRTAPIHFQRAFTHGFERGGWFVLSVWDDSGVHSAGPFASVAEAEQIGRQIAERMSCVYVEVTTAEKIEAANQIPFPDNPQLRFERDEMLVHFCDGRGFSLETVGPFDTVAEAREYVTEVAASGVKIRIDWSTFPAAAGE